MAFLPAAQKQERTESVGGKKEAGYKFIVERVNLVFYKHEIVA